MRPVCFRNIPPYTREELLSLFSKYGAVQCFSISPKGPKCSQTLAFVCFENEDVGQDAIDDLQNWDLESGTMTAEWSKTECVRRHDSTPSNMSPTKSLFVFNFDTRNTRVTDLETHFNKYGEVVNVYIVRDHAFVDFARQEDATNAFERAHMRDFGGRLLKVDYSNSRPRGSRSPIIFRSRGRHSRSPSPVTRRSRVHSRSRSPVTRRSRSRRGSADDYRYDRRSRHNRSRSSDTRGSPDDYRYDRRSRHNRSRSPDTRGSHRYDRRSRHKRSRSPDTRGSPDDYRYDRRSRHKRSRSPDTRGSPDDYRYDRRSRHKRSRSPDTRGSPDDYRYDRRSRHKRSRSPDTRGSHRYDHRSRHKRSRSRYRWEPSLQ